ncbi:hypothetical protein AQUCO_01500120v1 [Aquilegia coerulea]|uniref:Patatin n=1 Tax=Aquilegia coerulea TaxID=218851 RepID=A0A2G5DS98_AQUCA|nr:hypothetical protein AQUCO_01500120v1 [Aquilegia coerulea]
MGPEYDGVYLHDLLRKELLDTRLSQTLTNVAIPTFDIKRLQPVIFSNFQLTTDPTLDALLSDICIGTSAAPTYLPAYHFENEDKDGNIRDFDLVDGGVTANNPTLVAVTELTKQIYNEDPNYLSIKPMDYGKFLVISLGTGTARMDGKEKYNADMAAKWGLLGWLTAGGSSPLIDVFTQSSGDMVDYHLSVVFQALNSEPNYIRIQEDTLSTTESSTDLATTENLNALVEIGGRLLKKPVTRVNLDTGGTKLCESGDTNEEALIKFAKLLSDERNYREVNSIGKSHRR